MTFLLKLHLYDVQKGWFKIKNMNMYAVSKHLRFWKLKNTQHDVNLPYQKKMFNLPSFQQKLVPYPNPAPAQKLYSCRTATLTSKVK